MLLFFISGRSSAPVSPPEAGRPRVSAPPLAEPDPASYRYEGRMFTVYVLRSLKSGTYYVGQTNNLADRIKRHNSNTEKATRNRGPWELVYSEQFATRAEAWNREREIKAQKERAYIDRLVASHRGVAQPG